MDSRTVLMASQKGKNRMLGPGVVSARGQVDWPRHRVG